MKTSALLSNLLLHVIFARSSYALVPISHLPCVTLKQTTPISTSKLTSPPPSILTRNCQFRRSPLLKPKLHLSAESTEDSSISSSNTSTSVSVKSLLRWWQQATPESAKNTLTLGLAFLTGWADVALVMKYKTFATMMTGNLMWMASAFADGRHHDVIYYASVIACYIAGLVGFRRSEMTLKNKSLTVVCAPLVAALFCGADYLSYIHPAKRMPSVLMLSAGFAIINSVSSEVAGTLAFVVTGHITKLTSVFFDRFSRTAGRKRLSDADVVASYKSATVIAGFFSGALWACTLFHRKPEILVKGGTFGILGLLYAFLFLWQDRETLQCWWMKNDKMCDLDTYETECK